MAEGRKEPRDAEAFRLVVRPIVACMGRARFSEIEFSVWGPNVSTGTSDRLTDRLFDV